uniref:Uncharacterized protein n=1 Tax=Strigamia maritima TaxID=126957 RepID=T1J006_STRMM
MILSISFLLLTISVSSNGDNLSLRSLEERNEAGLETVDDLIKLVRKSCIKLEDIIKLKDKFPYNLIYQKIENIFIPIPDFNHIGLIKHVKVILQSFQDEGNRVNKVIESFKPTVKTTTTATRMPTTHIPPSTKMNLLKTFLKAIIPTKSTTTTTTTTTTTQKPTSTTKGNFLKALMNAIFPKKDTAQIKNTEATRIPTSTAKSNWLQMIMKHGSKVSTEEPQTHNPTIKKKKIEWLHVHNLLNIPKAFCDELDTMESLLEDSPIKLLHIDKLPTFVRDFRYHLDLKKEIKSYLHLLFHLGKQKLKANSTGKITTQKPTGNGKIPTQKPTGNGKISTQKPTGNRKVPTQKPTGYGKIPTQKPTGNRKVPTQKPTGNGKIPTQKPTGNRKIPTQKPGGNEKIPTHKPTGKITTHKPSEKITGDESKINIFLHNLEKLL